MRRRNKYQLFFLLLSGCCVTVLFVNPDNDFLFANATGDCNGRSAFMYNVLYRSPANADVALFGSSRTMNGINDSLMNALGSIRFLNMGYCRYGRNLDYFFIKEYCSHHHPKKIILEIREEEGDNTHPVTPFFLSVSEIGEGLFTGRTEVVKDLYDKWLCNLKYCRGKLFSEMLSVDPAVFTGYGFFYGYKPPDIAGLNTERQNDSIQRADKQKPYKALNANSAFYLKKLKALASEKHIDLYFLYLPPYGNLGKTPRQQKDFEAIGPVLLPPDSLMRDARNFSNYTHLNKRGADAVSTWLRNELEHISAP